MDLSAWTDHYQIALDNWEGHLLQCQESVLRERLLDRLATAKSLQACLRRHLDLSLHTLALFEEQRILRPK